MASSAQPSSVQALKSGSDTTSDVARPPRLTFYRLFSGNRRPSRFTRRIFAIAFIGTHLPLLSLIIYLVGWRGGDDAWILFAIALVATLVGAGLTLAALRAFAEPVYAATQSLARYAQSGELPSLPEDHADELGALMRNTQTTLTQLDAQSRELHELCIKDELTELYNRRFILETAHLLIARDQRYDTSTCLVMVDVDHFKMINDGFSHQVGDRVLQTIATIMMDELRASDLVSRLGGDEFLLVFPRTSYEEAATLVERLQRRIDEYDWSAIAPDLTTSISAGICSGKTHQSMEDMLETADARMYQAKHGKRSDKAD